MLVKTIARKTLGLKNHKIDKIKETPEGTNIPAFSRFLTITALSNRQIINYTNISNDSQVPSSTIQEYFQILRDTLIGSRSSCMEKIAKKKTNKHLEILFL